MAFDKESTRYLCPPEYFSPLHNNWQTVVLDDDHVADAEIFRGKLQLVALLEHFKELIRPSSSEFLMESF